MGEKQHLNNYGRNNEYKYILTHNLQCSEQWSAEFLALLFKTIS